MKKVFVDGYNVINSWPQLRDIKDYSYEAARIKLIDMLQNYAAFKGWNIIIVFDAHMVKGSLEKKEREGNLIIVFTREGETADSYIERAVNNIGRSFEVHVVTSDSMEQQVTFQRGAVRISSLEFYHSIINDNKRLEKRYETRYSSNRNLLEENIDKESAEKLEKIRRSK
ncbi:MULTISPECIES: NYN domain-containing protein [Clostridium]|uniref:NYN domain-containing protein n=1 Tax=Clostridium TaxID=1485 RepID=UPI000317DF47|nr:MULTISPECIES: NYN domain-containing protein [Clostridium]